jgi:NSS family neurotransmitter:Na+ symporter
MTIAALTSSISMLEVPVAYLVERWKLSRPSAVVLMTFVIGMLSTCLVFNFDRLFGFIIALTTEYSQPLLGMVVCLFMGWLWRRHHILEELKSGSEQIESSLFWAIWPWYVKFVCPVIILIMFFNSVSE